MKRVPVRGGDWGNSAIAGVFALNLNNDRSNSNTNIGARPALRARLKRVAYRAARRHTLERMRILRPAATLCGAGKLNRQDDPVRPCGPTVLPCRLHLAGC